MGKFRDFLEASGLPQVNFRGLSRDESLALGRDKAEPFVKAQLALYGINITGPTSFHEDAVLKIDGYWEGAPVQIKIRTSKKNENQSTRNDIAYELIKNYSYDMLVSQQLKDPYRAGKDFSCKAEYYFMMNQAKTFIYQIPGIHLKSTTRILVEHLDHLWTTRRRVAKPLQSIMAPVKGFTQLVDIKCVEDRDVNLYRGRSGFKLIAYIPVESIASNAYPVRDLSVTWPAPVRQSPQTINKSYRLPDQSEPSKPELKEPEPSELEPFQQPPSKSYRSLDWLKSSQTPLGR
jgi:hypothetical protein